MNVSLSPCWLKGQRKHQQISSSSTTKASAAAGDAKVCNKGNWEVVLTLDIINCPGQLLGKQLILEQFSCQNDV